MKFLYQNSSLLSEVDIQAAAASLLEYTERLKKVAQQRDYTEPESSIYIPFDKSIVSEVLSIKGKVHYQNLKYILVVGIGGSNLGTKAAYDALYGYFDVLEKNRYPKILFIDTTDSEYLARLEVFLDSEITSLEEIVINVISKSGNTTETISNVEFIMSVLRRKFEKPESQLVITSNNSSQLGIDAENKDIANLGIPEIVGGRYSVFSAVGLFPLILTGFNIEKFLNGAQVMREVCLESDIFKNPALLSATILFLHSENKKTINDNFIFHPELESLGKWYRQLMGESLGKEKGVNGDSTNIGITPTVSIGSTDLHSVGQLYLGGPRDKVTTFIYSDKTVITPPVPQAQERLFRGIVPMIEGKTASDIMSAILEGVKIAYTKNQLPFTEVILDDISEYSIGEFLQFKMIEIMYLGKLMGINAFDQPNVELYKEETRKLLSGLASK